MKNQNGFAKYHTILGFAPLIIILVIAILGVVGYFGYKSYLLKPQPADVSSPSPSTVSQTEKSITNWETYTNSKYKFSIDYPSTWYLSTKDYPNHDDDYRIFSIYKGDPNNSRLDLFKNFQGGYCEGAGAVNEKPIIFNNGIVGKKYACNYGIYVQYKVGVDNYWLVTAFVDETNVMVFDQMISTFKFTK